MFYKLFNFSERTALRIAGLAWIATLICFWVFSHNWVVFLVISVVSFSSATLYYYIYLKNRKLLDQITSVTEEWRKGSVEHRIIRIGGRSTKVQQVAWALNDLMDQVETAQVDMHYSMAYITYGDFSRRSYPEGLHGSFAHASKRLNSLTKVLLKTTSGINSLMAALSVGDFNKRIDTTVEGEYQHAIDSAMKTMKTMQELIANIGSVMGAVAQGNVSHRVQAEGQGEFAVLKDNVNLSLDALEGSLNEITRIALALAKGDLTQNSEQNYPGVFGDLISGMNHTGENLRMLVSDIKESSIVIANAAQEIATGNYDLSRRTIEQAANLEKTAANMNEFTHTIKENSSNAQHANELVQKSSKIAKDGVLAVGQVVKTMEGINESSRKIVDIISVIDSIAFQTNILALNAAVEAARAGEQGRGFAVVATEVRSLAQRAATAAGEIKSLINDSVEKVEDGSFLAIKAGKTMEGILSSIEGVTNMIGSISASSNEQISSVDYVNQSLTEIDDTTQQNSALVEEAAASAKSLEDQTHVLSSTISNFKINS